jgi:signal transduction histidine kinase
MQSITPLKFGILPTFRLMTGAQLAITVFGMVTPFRSQTETVTLTVFNVVWPALLLLYLSISWLRRTLGSRYLPLAIVWAAVGAIIEPYIAPELNAQWVWRQSLMLFIPLLVVSLEYGMREVIVFSVLSFLANIVLLARLPGLLTNPLLTVVLIEMLAYLSIGNLNVRLIKVQRDQWQRLSEANRKLAQHAATLEQLATSQERNRMARELHDVLAHTLSGVAVQLEGLRVTMDRDPARAAVLLNDSLHAIREGLSETRRALHELRAKPLEDLGLVLAIRTMAESFAGRHDLQVKIETDHEADNCSPEVQQAVYRITQEALANIAQHAGAQNVKVSLMREADRLKLHVLDDGGGFDVAAADEEHHFGLLGMRERARMIDGTLLVESERDQGTGITFTVRAVP